MKKQLLPVSLILLICFSCGSKSNENQIEQDNDFSVINGISADREVKEISPGTTDNNIVPNEAETIPRDNSSLQLPVKSLTILRDSGFPTTELTSEKLNTYGYKLYSGKEYESASEIFRCALLLDFDNMIAHYNRACALSILYGMGEKVDTDILFTHLRRAISLDNGRYEKMKTDSDLDPVRNLPEYAETLENFPLVTKDPEKYTEDFFIGFWGDGTFGMEIKKDHTFDFNGTLNDHIYGKWTYSSLDNQFTLIYSEISSDPSFFNIENVTLPYYRYSETVFHKKIVFNDGYVLTTRDENIIAMIESANKDKLIDKIKNGLGIDSPVANGDSIIDYAASLENHENAFRIVRTLLEYGADPYLSRLDDTPLLNIAVYSQNIGLVKYLLDIGINPNIKDRYYGENALFRITDLKSAQTFLDLLCSSGADINSIDNEGRTILHTAIILARYGLVEKILEKNINKNIKDKKNRTALECSDSSTPQSINDLLK